MLKLLGGLGPQRAKLKSIGTALGAAGVAGEALWPPTAFAAKILSKLSSAAMSLSRDGYSVMLCWQV